jgi:hypothetical protein
VINYFFFVKQLRATSKGKGKVVTVLLTEHHAMNVRWGSEDIALLIL